MSEQLRRILCSPLSKCQGGRWLRRQRELTVAQPSSPGAWFIPSRSRHGSRHFTDERPIVFVGQQDKLQKSDDAIIILGFTNEIGQLKF